MFIGAYHFDGSPTELVPAYDRLMATYPPEAVALHVCVIGDGGLTVFDACPTRDVFDDFSHSEQFTGALTAAGLPTPRIEPLGDVHWAQIRESVRP